MVAAQLVAYDLSDPKFFVYMCGTCGVHIAIPHDFLRYYLMEDGAMGHLFSKAINVEIVTPEEHREIGARTVADLYCLHCRAHVGWKFIRVPENDPVVAKDNVHLNLKHFVLCNGLGQVWDQQKQTSAPDHCGNQTRGGTGSGSSR